MLSLSKHDRGEGAPFDKLRVIEFIKLRVTIKTCHGELVEPCTVEV